VTSPLVAIGTKFFYTRSLPCTLWFFDKGKPEDLQDQVLMIDARNVYHVVSARSHVFTEEQLANLTAITWLYRGEHEKFVALVGGYQRKVDDWLAALPGRLHADTRTLRRLALKLMRFARDAKLNEELLPPPPADPPLTPEQQAELTQQRAELQVALDAWKADLAQALADTSAADALAALLYDLIAEKWAAKADALDAQVTHEEALFASKGKAPTDLLKTRRAHVDWMRATEICVVVSQEQGEVAEFQKWTNHRGQKLDITPHREKMVKRNLEDEFKKAENPFRVAIVCAMWLTGFDVKCLATMYLDKPMQGHTLMQAIARVNRVGGGKKHGLVIDYNGMLKSLRKALATFAQGDRKGTGKGEGEEDTVRDDSVALAEYADSLLQARGYLEGLGVDLDAVIEAKGFIKQGLLLDAVNAFATPQQLAFR
jgi:hypothetical protein